VIALASLLYFLDGAPNKCTYPDFTDNTAERPENICKVSVLSILVFVHQLICIRQSINSNMNIDIASSPNECKV